MAVDFGFKPFEDDFIFASYFSRDPYALKRAKSICQALNEKGVRLWYDWGIPLGKEWEREISRHIRKSKFVLMFISSALLYSEEGTYDNGVKIEYNIARTKGKMVVPVFIDKLDMSKVSDDFDVFLQRINRLQVINVSEYSDGKDAAKAIIDQLIYREYISSDELEKEIERREAEEAEQARREAKEAAEAERKAQAARIKVARDAETERQKREAAVKNAATEKAKTEAADGDNARRSSKKSWIAAVAALLVLVVVGGGVAVFKSLSSSYASPAEDFTYTTLGDGTLSISKYKGEETEVIIPKTIHNKKVTKINSYAFYNNDKVKNIIIPNSVTIIDESVFLYVQQFRKHNNTRKCYKNWTICFF